MEIRNQIGTCKNRIDNVENFKANSGSSTDHASHSQIGRYAGLVATGVLPVAEVPLEISAEVCSRVAEIRRCRMVAYIAHCIATELLQVPET